MNKLYSAQAAAEIINEVIYEKDGSSYWSRMLENNRTQTASANYAIPFLAVDGNAFYQLDELAKFVEFEEVRRLGNVESTGRAAEVLRACGIDAAGGSTSGRKLDCSILPQVDAVTGVPYVSILVDDPLFVFRVELDQARLINTELTEIIKVCERATS